MSREVCAAAGEHDGEAGARPASPRGRLPRLVQACGPSDVAQAKVSGSGSRLLRARPAAERTHTSSARGKRCPSGDRQRAMGRSLDGATSLQNIWKTAPVLR